MPIKTCIITVMALFAKMIITKLRQNLIEVVVFICGAIVMIFELIGSRLLAPYFGTSIIIWSSLIGIILASLSLGYWLGGIIADQRAKVTYLSTILLCAGLCVLATEVLNKTILSILAISVGNLQTNAILASIILFSPTSVLLGMVSPYALKLKILTLKDSGKTAGTLYAISTIGSIFGTFLAGFFLIPHFGNSIILFILSVVLIGCAVLLGLQQYLLSKITLLLIFEILTFLAVHKFNTDKNLIEALETQYNSIYVKIEKDPDTKRLVRVLYLNNMRQSASFLDSDDLVYDYTKYYRLMTHFKPNFTNALMLGGGAYSYPNNYLKQFPQASIDVVEIDPMVTQIAKKHFNLRNNPRLHIFHDDGRTYLNRNTKKYDVFLGDAFATAYSAPYSLTTLEATKKVYESLKDDGIAIINIISTMDGDASFFLKAEYNTYKEIFPQVYIFPVMNPENKYLIQNIMLVALKSQDKPIFESADSELSRYLKNLSNISNETSIPVLTDDYAPTDFYASKMF